VCKVGLCIEYGWLQRPNYSLYAFRSDPLMLKQLLSYRHNMIFVVFWAKNRSNTGIPHFLFTKTQWCFFPTDYPRNRLRATLKSTTGPRGPLTVTDQVCVNHHEIIVWVFNHYADSPPQHSKSLPFRSVLQNEIWMWKWLQFNVHFGLWCTVWTFTHCLLSVVMLLHPDRRTYRTMKNCKKMFLKYRQIVRNN